MPVPPERKLTMPVPITIFESDDDLGRATAALIADGIRAAAADGRPYLLGCPTGRSPRSTYAHLARETAEGGLDLRGLRIVLMDEYVVSDERGMPRGVDPELGYSCLGYAWREVLEPLTRAAGEDRAPEPGSVWLPDPADPGAYDARIADAGGIDLFLLATGASDGHVALNPQGSARDSTTRVVELSAQTRSDNVATFPAFRSIDDVPTHGVTVGIDTIRALSRRVVMVASGEGKRASVERLAAATGYDPSWPATVVAECAHPLLYVDRAAAPAATLIPR
jgi:glucosamine-6-phosphate deaminase